MRNFTPLRARPPRRWRLVIVDWKRIRELFDLAVEHEPAARREFVRSACDGDSSLESRVLALLAQDSNEKLPVDGTALAAFRLDLDEIVEREIGDAESAGER